jgi:hypothetical protein
MFFNQKSFSLLFFYAFECSNHARAILQETNSTFPNPACHNQQWFFIRGMRLAPNTIYFKEDIDMNNHKFMAVVMVFLLAGSFQACSSSSSSGNGPSGSLSVAITDAPGDFDNVYITVKDIWLHTSDSAGPQEAGWIKKPLAAPVTVDLLTLTNGTMQSLWSGVTLPVGDYQQIRLILADSDDPLTASASAPPLNLSFNNEVIDNNSVEYPLHIPDASHGILLVGHFRITDGGTLRLAIDFDADNDVVEFRHGQEYILKPRLRYFDLDNVGAIIGRLSTGGTFTTAARFVIKAEGLSNDGTYHVINRWTIPKADGSFVLYPISAATPTTYDVLVRGLNYQTVIIKGVPVTRGTTPASGATDIGTITMTAATTPDFMSNGSISSPTGAWLNFYQTLPGEVPYEIRFRNFFPLTGKFPGYPLSSEPILMGTYGPPPISLTSTMPVEGAGNYHAVADAILYNRSGWGNLVSASSPTVTITTLSVQSNWSANAISGNIIMSNPNKMGSMMDSGIVFAVHGGMIVNAVDVKSQMTMTNGGAYAMPNMPGGTPSNPHPLAFYGVEAIGWDSLHPRLHRAIAIPAIADLRIGDDTSVNMDMLPLW